MSMSSTKKENRKNLLKRIGITVGILLIYDLLTYVTIPGVDPRQLSKITNNPALTMMAMFSGGGFQTFSLMSMGLSAYISSQIIVQLMQSNVIPILTEWSQEGEIGRKKLTKLTRWLTLILGFVQGIGIVASINSLSQFGYAVDNSWWTYLVIGTLLTAGTFLAMWFGDQITQYGLGNGISVIIMAGIVKRLPDMAKSFYLSVSTSAGVKWDLVVITLVLLVVLTAIIIWFNRSEYRLPVQYTRTANRLTDNTVSKDSYLPLKLIVPGVVPVIFASSILTIPQTIMMFVQAKSDSVAARIVNDFFSLNSPSGTVLYGILIVLFTYIYSLVQVEPNKLADNLSKQDAYIPGVWPGDSTAIFVKNLIYDLDLPGSAFLALISVVPLIASSLISPSLEMGLSGSSLLIIVGVLTDMGRQIEGLKVKEGFSDFMSLTYSFK
ncbi:preprotein translocase subunit SecY [Lactobacillus crispatus]|uniref:preprotein translocase subunit SecY n=2 Tax=Lactobacillus crispatus TaxID=47770 RepID=UPI001F0F514F|nr:preprotein translocase subunit SecY [Lactobacillus crispatus]MCT7730879.1 preprotein translocase subunit SecY [Lactobacillus crispatus]